MGETDKTRKKTKPAESTKLADSTKQDIAIDCTKHSGRKKIRNEEENKKLIRRLKKAEGQIRGIQNMIENDAYCADVLVQVSAVSAALNSFNKELLACHIKSCVSEDIRKGDDEAIEEFVKMLQKLMK